MGAGSDSYYEYCLKAYILLGDEEYRKRFQLVSPSLPPSLPPSFLPALPPSPSLPSPPLPLSLTALQSHHEVHLQWPPVS